MKAAMLCIGVLIGVVVTGAIGQHSKSERPWMQPAEPTELEWLTLQKQADEGQNEFAEDGIEINFYLRSDSWESGTIYCDVAYEPQVPARILQTVIDGIQTRFEVERREYPWAHVKIITKAAP